MQTETIAILGWGSLLWDSAPDFQAQIGGWSMDGPELPLEFSRVSKSRSGALTLVIDTANGQMCKSAFALSRRTSVEEAVSDLQSREGTTSANIGYYIAQDKSYRTTNPSVLVDIDAWLSLASISAVVWTDLRPNFLKQVQTEFSVQAALAYLLALPPEGKARSREYLSRAPNFVNTPLRTAIAGHPALQSGA